jgi:signal transduction histidine kinase
MMPAGASPPRRASLPLPRRLDDVVDPTRRSPRSPRETREQACRPAPADVDSLAHDLWNILSSVRGYAQLLLSMVDDERAVEYLAIIEAESSRCCGVLERMLRPADAGGTADAQRSAGAGAAGSRAASICIP